MPKRTPVVVTDYRPQVIAGAGSSGGGAQPLIVHDLDSSHSGSLPWARVNKAGSSLVDLVSRDHASLTGIGTNSHATIDTHIANGNIHVDHSAITLTAGDGLTGGGTIAANRTFAVGAGNGIAVAADAVAVDLAADPGLEFSSGKLRAKVGDGIGRDANGLFVDLATDPGLEFATGKLRAKVGAGIARHSTGLIIDQGFAPTWTGQHIFNAQVTLGATLRSATFSDSSVGIAGFQLADVGSNVWRLTLAGMKADNLYARAFVADETRVNRGAEYWSKGYGVVQQDFTLPADEATVLAWFEDAPSIAGDIFAVNDWLLIRTVDWATGLVLSSVWMQVTARSPLGGGDPAGQQRWTLRRKAGGTTGQVIRAGSVALNMGQSGQGWVHVSGLNGDGGPFVQVGDWATDPSVPANVVNRVRMGKLDGVAGLTGSKWGFVAAKNLAVAKSHADFEGVVVEAGGVEIYGKMFVRDNSEFRGVVSIGTSGGIYQGTGTFASPTTGLKLWNDSGLGRIAGYNAGSLQWYAGTDGKLYAGAGDVVLDRDGITLAMGDAPDNIIKWKEGSTTEVELFGLYGAGGVTQAGLRAINPNGSNQADIKLEVWDTSFAGTLRGYFYLRNLGSGVTQTVLDSTEIRLRAAEVIFGNSSAESPVVASSASRRALQVKPAVSTTVPVLEVLDESAVARHAFWSSYGTNIPAVRTMAGYQEFSITPGNITTQTLTVDVVGTQFAHQPVFMEVVGTFRNNTDSNLTRAVWVDDVLWRTRADAVTDATIDATTRRISEIGNVTVTGPTAIGGGVRYTVKSTAQNLVRAAMLLRVYSAATVTVTAGVA